MEKSSLKFTRSFWTFPIFFSKLSEKLCPIYENLKLNEIKSYGEQHVGILRERITNRQFVYLYLLLVDLNYFCLTVLTVLPSSPFSQMWRLLILGIIPFGVIFLILGGLYYLVTTIQIYNRLKTCYCDQYRISFWGGANPVLHNKFCGKSFLDSPVVDKTDVAILSW